MENKKLQEMLDKDDFQGVYTFAMQSKNPKEVYLEASRYFEAQEDFVKAIAYAQECNAKNRIFDILDNNSPKAYNQTRSFLRIGFSCLKYSAIGISMIIKKSPRLHAWKKFPNESPISLDQTPYVPKKKAEKVMYAIPFIWFFI